MDLVGEKLKTAREQLGFTHEQISRETNISKRFLKALEDEDFSVFPGETYLLGFLTNYAEYLGLNPQELINLYRNIKIQEQPVPLEQLLEKRNDPKNLLFIGAGVIAAIIIIILVVLLFRKLPSNNTSQNTDKNFLRNPKDFTLSQEKTEARFYINQEITIPINNQNYKIKIASINEDQVLLLAPDQNLSLSIGTISYLDFDHDNRPEVEIQLKDMDRNNPSSGVILNLKKALQTETNPQQITTTNSLGLSGLTILESEIEKPFEIRLTFKRKSLIHFQSDNQERIEKYLDADQIQSITAQRELKIWLVNAGSVKLTSGGMEYELGKSGETAVYLTKWIKNEGSGKYKLELLSLK